MPINKIISGGQTGAEQAGLDNAIQILNVAGSRASGDGLIYEKTTEVIEGGVER